MVVPAVDHECALTAFVAEMSNRLAKLEHENAQLKKALLGSRSEQSKLPRIKKAPVSAETQAKTRKSRKAQRAKVHTIQVEHTVPDEDRRCAVCGDGGKLDALGEGKKTIVWEFVPARFIRVEHVQEVLRCRCNGFVITAPGAPKVVEKGQYGASFLAHLAVSKCADHLPIYRLEKAFARAGIPVARSTMNELLHRTSSILQPLWERLLQLVRARHVVGADETRLRMIRDKEGKTKNGFVWTFGAEDADGGLDIAYVFADDRSAATPKEVLEGTSGVLMVDGYSGYNVVDSVSTRRRAACYAHVRRYFFEAIPTAAVAQEMLDLVGELYRVEHDADEKNLRGEPRRAHRQARAGPIRKRMRKWLDAQRDVHPPKSPIGTAMRYVENQWDELGVFIDDERVPLDNNGSERALRRIALGRKNFLFVHDTASGKSIAGLYSLVATCEARGVNPFDYLTDVLQRIDEHPAKDIDALLPAAWASAHAATA